MRHDSSLSIGSNSGRDARKKKEKGRAAERRRKLDAQASDIDIGHIVDADADVDDDDNNDNYNDPDNAMEHNYDDSEEAADQFVTVEDATVSFSKNVAMAPVVDFKNMRSTTLDRSSSDQSTGSLLYCKTPSTGIGGPMGMLGGASLGKTSGSLIFPTGVDSVDHHHGDDRPDSADAKLKRSKVNLRLDQAEAVRFPFKKKLMLNNLNLTATDVPMKDLCGTPLGNSLHKLSLAGNRLGAVPSKLVQFLPQLKRLDLSNCELHQLPEQWNLPKLAWLNLSRNRFTEFPEEVRTNNMCCCFCRCMCAF